MANIAVLTFSPFAENTYVIYDDTGSCVIIDPGCYSKEEKQNLAGFITDKKLSPTHILNTHCHADHVLGNRFVADKYKIPLVMHKGEVMVLNAVKNYADSLGIDYEESPQPEIFLNEGDEFGFGNTNFKILFTPGHSPASICFLCEQDKFIVSGDVLFYDSIGRTDLPGGNYNTLMSSIDKKIMILDDDIKVYPGHMQATTIGRERRKNPFLNEASIK